MRPERKFSGPVAGQSRYADPIAEDRKLADRQGFYPRYRTHYTEARPRPWRFRDTARDFAVGAIIPAVGDLAGSAFSAAAPSVISALKTIGSAVADGAASALGAGVAGQAVGRAAPWFFGD